MYRVNRCVALALVVGCSRVASAEAPPAAMFAPDTKLVEVHTAKAFFEGPTWDPVSGKLYFTAFAKDPQILRRDAPGKTTVWLEQSAGVNGTYLSNDGRLLGAQGNGKRIVSFAIGADGPQDTKVLYANDQMLPPNDLCQTPRGDIYFTSPDFQDRKASAVYRVGPEGKGQAVITDLAICNGIIAANDGRTLYVADSWKKHWRAYPIAEDGSVGAGRLFFDPQTENQNDPDGMSIDERGNLYFAGRGGIWIVSPEGQQLGMIPVPEFCSNVTFGGADGKTLYLTCSEKVYSFAMQVRGGQFAKRK